MYLKDKLYLSGTFTITTSSTDVILIYTPATDTRDKLDTPVYDFALTTYRSKLVLVGGREYVGENVKGRHSNKLWTLSKEGKWEETFPPMETACDYASAVSHEDHLLVVDGDSKEVHVYNGHHWAEAQHLPEEMKPERPSVFKQQKSTKSVVFNGKLYVFGECWPRQSEVYSASLDSLIASSQPSETSQPSTVWKRLPGVSSQHCRPVVFRNRLIAIGFDETGHNAIYDYSPSDYSWKYVGAPPLSRCLIFFCSSTFK